MRTRRFPLAQAIRAAWILLGLSSLALLAACATPGVETDKDISLNLDPALVQRLSGHMVRANTRLSSIEVREIITNVGNFGIPVTYYQRMTFQLMPGGMVLVTTVGARSAAELNTTSTGTRSVSLCGLVSLTTETASVPPATTTVLPAGKVFVPITSGPTYSVVTRARLDAIETTHSQLCHPKR